MLGKKWCYVILILTALFLTSCSHTSKNDGPPDYNVDVSNIPNAVPKPEPRAKYGNMSSYRVFGKRYYILRSSHNYDAVGTASWYGKKFHNHHTSSGERYDMLAMTAAHKTLPLPTYVEVTNLANQRKIVVKVNDRGPFASDRLIDLSFVAAKKLGMLGRGTARVRIKAIEPGTRYELAENSERAYSYNVIGRPLDKPVYLQVGAFRSKSRAEKLRQRLASLLEAPVNIAVGHLYRVQVGPIEDVATEARISNQLHNLGIEANKQYAV